MLHDGLIHSPYCIAGIAQQYSETRPHGGQVFRAAPEEQPGGEEESRREARPRKPTEGTLPISWKETQSTIIVESSSSQIKVLCLENANRLLRTQLAREKEVVAELSEAVQRLSDKLEEMRQRESGGGGGGSGNSRLMRN